MQKMIIYESVHPSVNVVGEGSFYQPLFVIKPAFQAHPKYPEHRNVEKLFNAGTAQFKTT